MRWGWLWGLFFCALVVTGCAGTGREIQVVRSTQNDLVENQRFELQVTLGKLEGVEIFSGDNSVAVILCCDQLFESSTTRILPKTGVGLDEMAGIIKKYAGTKVKIDAHTDCIRSEEENLELSEMQAGALKDALVARGITSSSITARGWGESKPIASNATDEGRLANRRIAVTLIPNQS